MIGEGSVKALIASRFTRWEVVNMGLFGILEGVDSHRCVVKNITNHSKYLGNIVSKYMQET